MEIFKHIEDVEEWIDPMNYEQFWREIKPYCLVLPTREMCERDIAAGAKFEDVAIGVKTLAVFLLIQRHKLKRRPVGPMLRVAASQD